ncbi:hypothetical protein AAHB59_19040 [Bacillus cereus]
MEALIKSEKKQKDFVHLVQDEYKKEDKNFLFFIFGETNGTMKANVKNKEKKWSI